MQVDTIGCDVSDKKSELFILKPDGQGERPKAIKTTRACFRDYFQRPRAHVVIEVGQQLGRDDAAHVGLGKLKFVGDGFVGQRQVVATQVVGRVHQPDNAPVQSAPTAESRGMFWTGQNG